MQTFLPFPNYNASAEVLDGRRLVCQLKECKQILTVHKKMHEERENPGTWPNIGWHNHPAVRMWLGHEYALSCYMDAIFEECLNRGYKVEPYKYKEVFDWATRNDPKSLIIDPYWWGGSLHYTHRVKLCEKNWDHYSPLFPDVIDSDVGDLGYLWPAPVGKEHIISTRFLDDIKAALEGHVYYDPDFMPWQLS
jgi:hypothetical protein